MQIKTEGFADLERALAELEKTATAKGIMRRSLKKAAMPMKDIMHDLAPRGDTSSDALADSVTIGARLSKRQAGLHRKMFRNDKAAVEMFVGPGPDPAAWNQEFGNINHGPQPFARPAFDQEARPTLDRLGRTMWNEIEKTAARAARKAARLAKG